MIDEPEPPPDDSGATDANLQRAMRAFESGSANYNSAKYKDALSDFLEAASLYASPDFQYNIGLCYEKLDKPEEAIRAYEIYLKTKSEVPDRANVENRIAELRAEIAAREQQAAAKPEPDVRPPQTGEKQRKQAKALIGAGAALTAVGAAVALGGGLGLGIAAQRRSDDLSAIQSRGNPDDRSFADAEDLEDQGRQLEIGQIVSVAVGAAIGLTGIALLAVGAQRMSKAKRAPKVAFSPSFGARSFGLSLGGRF
ncbi:MAG: tetratricopeptide repeat protein [Deltaproteobacteria bacterium]|nr:tetratricopeptide repeat protein [Nannocystaceae bacterium]